MQRVIKLVPDCTEKRSAVISQACQLGDLVSRLQQFTVCFNSSLINQEIDTYIFASSEVMYSSYNYCLTL